MTAPFEWHDRRDPGVGAGHVDCRSTDEIQRNIIAERVLGMPKEPSVDTDKPYRDVPQRPALTPPAKDLTVNSRILFVKRPTGWVDPSCFALESCPEPVIGPQDVLVQARCTCPPTPICAAG